MERFLFSNLPNGEITTTKCPLWNHNRIFLHESAQPLIKIRCMDAINPRDSSICILKEDMYASEIDEWSKLSAAVERFFEFAKPHGYTYDEERWCESGEIKAALSRNLRETFRADDYEDELMVDMNVVIKGVTIDHDKKSYSMLIVVDRLFIITNIFEDGLTSEEEDVGLNTLDEEGIDLDASQMDEEYSPCGTGSAPPYSPQPLDDCVKEDEVEDVEEDDLHEVEDVEDVDGEVKEDVEEEEDDADKENSPKRICLSVDDEDSCEIIMIEATRCNTHNKKDACYIWKQSEENVQRYYACKHGFVCPTCLQHSGTWIHFVENHRFAGAFTAKKNDACAKAT